MTVYAVVIDTSPIAQSRLRHYCVRFKSMPVYLTLSQTFDISPSQLNNIYDVFVRLDICDLTAEFSPLTHLSQSVRGSRGVTRLSLTSWI